MTDKTDSKERAEFEAHMRKLNACTRLERQSEAVGGNYRTISVQRAWELWQAARASLTVSAGSGPLMGQPQEMPDLSALTERGAKAWAGVDARELREGFTAADMATANAQGFRDGVASIAASAGSEPVAWALFAENGNIRIWSQKPLQHPAMPLYLHPSPPEGMVGGWISVAERLPPPFEEVVVYPRPDDYCCEAFCDTAGNWRWAEYEHDFGVHHRECQVEYWLMLPEVPAPPTSSADSRKVE